MNAEDLIGEIERYLTAVALFRAEGCEPRWASEALNVLVQRVTIGGENIEAGQLRS